MNAHPSTLRAAALLLAFGSALACSAILKPRDKVTRCGNADDCDPTGDKRYVPVCTYDEAHQNNGNTSTFDKICVADYNQSIGCNPMNYANMPDHPFTKAIDSCGDLGCDMANYGKLGCPPREGVCDEGTSQQFGEDGPFYCGDDDIVPGFALADDLEAQHVKDAFCKSFFCDDEFICNSSGKCHLCDPDLAYGDGGCGTVYADGAPAPVYLLGDALDEACAHGDADVDDPVFGGGCGE